MDVDHPGQPEGVEPGAHQRGLVGGQQDGGGRHTGIVPEPRGRSEIAADPQRAPAPFTSTHPAREDLP
ncbi:hypothetical protein GCM10022415_11220 [Knoellia locipacati]|uniref:Uncharacterized protein n=1 Tax=Knoellia locipacati TaxID=882824 RepID=A0A512SYN6_9MICO|nr:hypothetical protein KLO01_11200 [Knoellia locipacati]